MNVQLHTLRHNRITDYIHWAVGVSLELILHWLSVSMAARGVSVSSFLYH